MNVVAMRPLPGPTAAPGSARLARVEIFRELAAAEPHWRALERGNALTTPYQHFDFLSLWQRHMGSPARVSPFVVVGFDAGGVPIFLWPFGRRSIGGLRAIEFLGGKHANFNVALWRRDAAAAIT